MNFMPINVKIDLTPLVESLAAIVNSTHKGVEKLSGLCLDHATAESVRDQMLRDAQNQSDAEAVKKGEKRYENGVLMDALPRPSGHDAIGMIDNAIRAEEVANFVKALGQTAKLLESMPQNAISDEPIRKTFYNRWRKEAEQIDDAELRLLWAQILACEVASPRSISMRTLDVVRNLSETEARLFQRMLKGEVSEMILIDGKGHPQYVNYSEALILQDAGLVSAQMSRRSFPLEYSIDEHQKGIVIPISKSGLVACVHKSEFSSQCYILTDAGKCLMRVAQENRSIQDFIEVFSRMSKLSNNVVISLHAIVSGDASGLEWSTVPLWTSKGPESTNDEEK